MQRRQSGANDPPLQAACVNGTLTVLSNATPSSPRYRAAWQMCHAWEWLSTDSKRSGTAEQIIHIVQWMCEPSSSERAPLSGMPFRWTRAFLRPAVLPALPDGAVHLAGLPHEKKERGKNNEYAGHRIDRRRVSVRCLRTLRSLAGKQVGHRPHRQDPGCCP